MYMRHANLTYVNAAIQPYHGRELDRHPTQSASGSAGEERYHVHDLYDAGKVPRRPTTQEPKLGHLLPCEW